MRYLLLTVCGCLAVFGQSNAGLAEYKPNARGVANGVKIEDALNARLNCSIVFGMNGNGTADNSAKVTNCVAMAVARGIKSIWFPPDRTGLTSFKLASAVTIDPAITDVGMPGGTSFLVPAGASGCWITAGPLEDSHYEIRANKVMDWKTRGAADTASKLVCVNGSLYSQMKITASGGWKNIELDSTSHPFYFSTLTPNSQDGFIDLALVGGANGWNQNVILGGELHHNGGSYISIVVDSDGAGNLTRVSGDYFDQLAVGGYWYETSTLTRYVIASITDSTHMAVATDGGAFPALGTSVAMRGPYPGTREVSCSTAGSNGNLMMGTDVEGAAVDKVFDDTCSQWTLNTVRFEQSPIRRVMNGRNNLIHGPYIDNGTWAGFDKEGAFLSGTQGLWADSNGNSQPWLKVWNSYHEYSIGNVDVSGNVTKTSGLSFTVWFAVGQVIHLAGTSTQYTITSITDATHMAVSPSPASALTGVGIAGRSEAMRLSSDGRFYAGQCGPTSLSGYNNVASFTGCVNGEKTAILLGNVGAARAPFSSITVDDSPAHRSKLTLANHVASMDMTLDLNAVEFMRLRNLGGIPLVDVAGGINVGGVYQGTWSSSTAYPANVLVTYSGAEYRSILAGTNQQPNTATTYWEPFTVAAEGEVRAARGVYGTTGRFTGPRSNSQPQFRFQDTATTKKFAGYVDASGGIGIGTESNDPFYVFVNNSVVGTFSSTGLNVIGAKVAGNTVLTQADGATGTSTFSASCSFTPTTDTACKTVTAGACTASITVVTGGSVSCSISPGSLTFTYGLKQ